MILDLFLVYFKITFLSQGGAKKMGAETTTKSLKEKKNKQKKIQTMIMIHTA